MKKIKIMNSRNIHIVANMNVVNSKTIVVLAHGFTNDKSSDGRFDRMTKALNHNGFDTLALDFSGSGESGDDALTIENQSDDLSSVLDYLTRKSYKRIILFGNSFGTIACLKNYRREIVTMVLTGAVTDSMKYQWSEFFTECQLQDLKSNGFIKLHNKREHLIVKQTLKDFEEVNQDDLLKNVKCPILIIHGDNKDDKEELELLSHSKRAINKLPTGSKLKIIKDGKHGFHDHWDEIIEITYQWIKQFNSVNLAE